MKMTNGLIDTIGPLLAADVPTLAPVAANKVALITDNFVPDMDASIGDFTLGSTTGLTPIAGVAGTQLESRDPVTGEVIVEIKTPAGGFRWETPDPFTDGPITVYGFLLIDNGAANWLGVHKLTDPITLDGPNQQITAPALTFAIDATKVY